MDITYRSSASKSIEWYKELLNQQIAQSFVNRISRQLGHNVNVMNEKAIIIASADKSRIGDFHACAYELITKNKDVSEVSQINEGLIGVKQPGINMLIRYKRMPVGVVGVSGEPDKVRQIAKVVKLMFDTILEYENNQLTIGQEKDYGGEFVYSLLFEKPLNLSRVLTFARAWGYRDQLERIPLIASFQFFSATSDFAERMLQAYRHHPSFDPQDILCPIEGNRLLLYKSFASVDLADYRPFVKSCGDILSELAASLAHDPSIRSELHCFCGGMQSAFETYSSGFGQTLWLADLMKSHPPGIYFLSDYLTDFLLESMPRETLNIVLRPYLNQIEEVIGPEIFTQTAQALVDCDMRLDEASKQLYVHRNTIVFRLRKIREALGIDPVNRPKDAILLTILLSHCQHSKD